jgi:hypothetical protein
MLVFQELDASAFKGAPDRGSAEYRRSAFSSLEFHDSCLVEACFERQRQLRPAKQFSRGPNLFASDHFAVFLSRTQALSRLRTSQLSVGALPKRDGIGGDRRRHAADRDPNEH